MKRSVLFSMLVSGIILTTQSVHATVIYESLPGSNTNHMSKHGQKGPVLADDFTPSGSGRVSSIEWWGSAPLNPTGTDTFEVTFHPDAGGTPNTTPAGAKLSQGFVHATGVDPDGDGIFHYFANWSPMGLFLAEGVDYWFSVANSQSSWTWASGLAPSVGSEQYDAVVSTGVGPDGGPHFGPWNYIADQDFAFRINVPEPALFALMGLGLAGFGCRRQREKKTS